MSKKKKKKNSNELQESNPVINQQSQAKDISEELTKFVAQEFSGPIPPPGILKGYEEIMPGVAERIFEMAEKQAEHRRELER